MFADLYYENMSDCASVQFVLLERPGMLSSLDYSGTSSNSDRDINCTEDYASLPDESDDDDAFISFTTTESRCEILFQRGLELKIQEDLADALLCFEDCLAGMQDCQYFAKLPQTLLQLHNLHKCLGNEVKAGEYGEAEKLFQEAIQPKLSSNSLLNGGSQQRTKRKPFSKKAPSLSASSCNPAEYGNLMVIKAKEYEKLASLQAEKGNMDLAMESCRKAVILRHCVYGQTVPVEEAAMTMFEYIYGELEERNGRLLQNNGAVCPIECSTANAPGDVGFSEGDLSITSPANSLFIETKGFDKREENVADRKLQSANWAQPGLNMWSTQETLADTQWQPLASSSTKHLEKGSPTTVNKSGFNDSTHSTTLDSTDLTLNHTPDLNITSEKDLSPSPTSCHHPHQDNTANGVSSKENHILDYCGGRVHPHDNGQCWAVPAQPLTDPLHHSQFTGIHPQHTHHHHHNNLCKGVTKGVKNLTKLSAELKAPMCVTLDVQTVKTDTGGMEHPRCLPLWVLLLGAFVEMALLAYMLYNH